MRFVVLTIFFLSSVLIAVAAAAVVIFHPNRDYSTARVLHDSLNLHPTSLIRRRGEHKI